MKFGIISAECWTEIILPKWAQTAPCYQLWLSVSSRGQLRPLLFDM